MSGFFTAEFKMLYRKLAKPFLKRQIGCTLLLLINSILNVSFPYFIKVILDEGVGRQNLIIILIYSGAMVVTIALTAVTGYWMRLSFLKIGQDVTRSIKKTILHAFDKYSLLFFNRYKNGELVSILENDVKNVEVLATYVLADILSNLLTAIGLFIILFTLNAEIAIGSLGFILLIFVIQRKFGNRMKMVSGEVSLAKGNMHAFTQEYLRGLMDARMLDASLPFQHKYMSTQNKLFQNEIGMARVKIMSNLTGTVFQGISLILVLGYGAIMVMMAHLTIGSLFTLTIYVQKLQGPVLALLNLYIDFKKTQASLQRVMELIDDDQIIPTGESRPVNQINGNINILNLSFMYNETSVLSGIHLSIKQGDSIAITGKNGSGKTTLTRLLLRLMDHYEGHIFIDGKDLREYDIDYYRSQVMCIGQTPFIFDGTIYENITMLKEGISEEAVHKALLMSCLDIEIEKMPQGLHTLIGAKGVKLSGGQSQKLALARAYLSNPGIILLDEPTSALDMTSEQIVCRNLFTHFKDTTIIAITHRAELLKYCHLTYNLDHSNKTFDVVMEENDELQGDILFETGTKKFTGLLSSS